MSAGIVLCHAPRLVSAHRLPLRMWGGEGQWTRTGGLPLGVPEVMAEFWTVTGHLDAPEHIANGSVYSRQFDQHECVGFASERRP